MDTFAIHYQTVNVHWKLSHNEYDVIFLDENMPKKSGADVLSEIKARGIISPVITVTKTYIPSSNLEAPLV